MLKRTQTVYVETDRFFSPRGKVLHGFERFLEELAREQIPCVWITSWTRAQIDEPRRRLGQNDPFIGENGCGVYLPEDYFHLKGSKTVRLGRYTCIPVAQPQPAAAEALEELAADVDLSVVPLRTLSPRELSQNTGLPGKEAELIRQRDFDELFFFAGASESDIAKFRVEAEQRGLVVEPAGAFWSLSVGGNLAKCVRELGGLYDRALRSHMLRIGVRAPVSQGNKGGGERSWPASAFDRILVVEERAERDDASAEPVELAEKSEEDGDNAVEATGAERVTREPAAKGDRKRFHLHEPGVWEEVLSAIGAGARPRGKSK